MVATFSDRLDAAKAELKNTRMLISEEIRRFPTPISGCDSQFNYLIAERQKISDAIAALENDVFVPTPRAPIQGKGIESR